MNDNRTRRASIAQETLAVLREGSYRTPMGRQVDLAAPLAESLQSSELIRPADWPSIYEQTARTLEREQPASIDVTAETTLAAARRLSSKAENRVLSLSFASAKNPGGGFLGGSQAQEESLARASGLYPCLLRHEDYYRANRQCGTLLYTDHAIHTPSVPVFRDDNDQLLENPYATGFPDDARPEPRRHAPGVAGDRPGAPGLPAAICPRPGDGRGSRVYARGRRRVGMRRLPE